MLDGKGSLQAELGQTRKLFEIRELIDICSHFHRMVVGALDSG